MKKHIKILSILFLFFYVSNLNSSFSFEVKKMLHIKKKEKPSFQKMVETRQEWEEQAKNVPLEERKHEFKVEKSTKTQFYPEPFYIFERYNYPVGSREFDISDVKKNLYSNPYLIMDKDCRYAAYSKFYFSPDVNQISSEFFVEKLDTSKTKIKRVLEFNHKQKERYPILSSGTKETYPNLFSSLTLVDWSSDSKKLLVKEKIGSTQNGIYKTNIYIHFLTDGANSGYTLKLENFDNAVKNYYLNYQDFELQKYQYYFEPLGFSSERENTIVLNCYTFDKDNQKVFLGLWGYDYALNQTILFSDTDSDADISTNGLILRQVLE